MSKYPDVAVQLTGEDGNVFAIISKVKRALVVAGYQEEAKQFVAEAFGSQSYEAVLALCDKYVEVS